VGATELHQPWEGARAVQDMPKKSSFPKCFSPKTWVFFLEFRVEFKDWVFKSDEWLIHAVLRNKMSDHILL
jgi:hypothetical protein